MHISIENNKKGDKLVIKMLYTPSRACLKALQQKLTGSWVKSSKIVGESLYILFDAKHKQSQEFMLLDIILVNRKLTQSNIEKV